jgi:predicted ATPase/class 3 adenylate cyclase
MQTLPTGTITFLYTDIEGSTLRWEKSPAAMKAAVERHDEIMRRAIETHGGSVFRLMGDAFCASFPTAPQGLLAALDAQRALYSETWDPEVVPIRVRMALHTGVGEVRDGDYVGTPLNRVARLLSTGYGGQTLLSRSAYDLVRYNLPDGLTLRDLGEHHLKDLAQAEHVFQLIAPGLPSDFPPLKSLDSRPNNLPTQPTPLVGRRNELVSICALIRRPDTRLITLTGPGGIGKTRLALQAAADLSDDFEDGVFFVPLAPIADPDLLGQTIVQALGMRDVGGKSPTDSLKEYLRDKQTLLVLDNFEQVVVGAPFVADLLAACPGVKALVASREVLHIRGEKECVVPPLPLPDPTELPSPDDLMRFDSVALFVQRAQDVRADFQLSDDNARAIAEICRRLDGLPLAIELAAARVKVLSPQAMLERLRSRLTLLTGGARDLPTRQQTLRNTIAWSYDLLPPPEQSLFRRLSVFVGGLTLEAAEAVCNSPSSSGPENDIDVFDGLMALVDKSLLRQEEHWDGESRFMMLETIQEFARQLLDEQGESAEVRERYASYFIELVRRVGPKVMSPERVTANAILEAEHDNIRAVLEWCVASPDRYETGLAIASDLAMFWDYRDVFMSEGRGWLAKMLALSDPTSRTGLRGNALMGAGLLSMALGDYPVARSALEQSKDICKEVGDSACEIMSAATLALTYQLVGNSADAIALVSQALDRVRKGEGARIMFSLAQLAEMNQVKSLDSPLTNLPIDWSIAFFNFVLGDAYLTAGDLEAARMAHTESLATYSKLGMEEDKSLPLTSLGKVAILQGNYEEARALLEESLAIRRKIGSSWFISITLITLSDLARYQGDYERAERLSQEGLKIARSINNIGGIAWALYNLGCAALHQGSPVQATSHFKESLKIRAEQGNRQQIAEDLLGLAEASFAQGAPNRAARLFGAINGTLGNDAHFESLEQSALERATETLRTHLGETAYNDAYTAGQSFTLDQAVDYALRNTDMT